jgi:hypothetical protein
MYKRKPTFLLLIVFTLAITSLSLARDNEDRGDISTSFSSALTACMRSI